MNAPSEHLAAKLQKANEFHGAGRIEDARAICEEILLIQPRNFDALHTLGLIAAQRNDLNLAVQLLDKAIQSDPNNAAAHCNRGTALQALKQWDAALASFDTAISLKPDFAVAHCNRGNLLNELRRWDAALVSYDKALSIKADFAAVWSNRGNVLRELKRWDAALASYDQALTIKADLAESWSNRGTVLKAVNRLREALASYDRAIAIRPGYAEAHANRGNVLKDLNDLDGALASYDRALAIKPNFANAHFGKAVALLSNGDFAAGWSGYEWRRKREFPQPLWLGQESLAGKTILLHCEQGLGDTLQFGRYATLVAGLKANVILEVQKPLVSLLTGAEGVSRVVAEGTPLPDVDFQCPLLSLPLAFKTTIDTIPAAIDLRIDPARVAQWQARLGERTGPRIGLVWRGNPNHVNDHNRSIPLAELVSHLPSEFHYVSLQHDASPSERAILQAHPAILHLADELHDFSDIAAVCACLDLVISVDTSVAHLSGSLQQQTWVLLPFNADWRWLANRTDSPWYPTAKLYRQEEIGDWGSVLRRVGADMIRTL